MNKVYIVTKGYYSDYSIYKIFLDKELAEEYAAQISEIGEFRDKAQVEEWEISTEKDIKLPKHFKRFQVVMDIDGNIPKYNPIRACSPDLETKEWCFNPFEHIGGKFQPNTNKKYWTFYVDTDKGVDGAIKIANEKRVRLITENKW